MQHDQQIIEKIDKLFKNAQQYKQEGRLRDAAECYRSIIELEPDNAVMHSQLGKLLIDIGQPVDAIDIIYRAIELNPDSSRSYNYLGMARKINGEPELARTSFEKAISIYPSNKNAHMNLAQLGEETGNLELAAEHYKRVIQLDPTIAWAHFQLAHLRNHISTESEVRTMKSLFYQTGYPEDQKITLAFALGNALEKRKIYNEAFDYFEAGHQLMNKYSPCNIEEYIHYFSSLQKCFTGPYVTDAYCATDCPAIFVVGMPRSGTTLTEQILASHPLVYGAGELGYISELTEQITQITGKDYLEGWSHLMPAEIDELAKSYLKKLRNHSLNAHRITDTTPMNFIRIGIIASIFPCAKIIHCIRDPMDNCLSIYQHPLTDGHRYAHNQHDLGKFYQLYEDLMIHWHKVFPGRIYDLRYESVVTDTEAQIRMLLEYCNLPFHENCLAFHKTSRSVRTPSTSQVRQPIYSSSMQRWKKYEDRLTVLKSVLSRP